MLLNLLKKILKFGPFITLSNLFLAYGNNLCSKSTLDRINQIRINKINKHLKGIIQNINSIPISVPTPANLVKEAIWICWFQGEDKMPPIARLCYDSIRRYCNDHPVILLTQENYKDYVVIPNSIENIYKNGKLKQAHFADILRINLLAQQGGLWLDSTMLLTKPVSEEIFKSSFYTIKSKPFGFFVSRCRWSVFMLAAKKDCVIFKKIAKAFELYLEKTDTFIDYFLFDHFFDLLYQTDPIIKDLIDSVPFNNLAVHDLNSILCDNYEERRIASIMENTYMFKLSNRSYTVDQLKNNPENVFNHFKSILMI